jgi:hypothetical protein
MSDANWVYKQALHARCSELVSEQGRQKNK